MRSIVLSMPILALILMAAPIAPLEKACAQDVASELVYYAVEIKGKLVGFEEISVFPGNEQDQIEYRKKTVLELSALGQDFDLTVDKTQHIDATTGKTSYIQVRTTRGDQENTATLVFEDLRVHFTPAAGGEKTILELTPDVIVNDELSLPFLLEDLIPEEGWKKTFRILDLSKCEIHENCFTWMRTETLEFFGKEFSCHVFDSIDLVNGLGARIWLDRSNARILKVEMTTGITAYLADPAVVERIERGDLDDSIFADVDVAIADFKAIDYMKVCAKIRTAGEWVTPESLNVPGQRFEGSVVENLVDGFFEIEHRRHDGVGAPPFPCDFSGDEALQEYLESEEMIESEDPAIVALAREITAGAEDSWQAARRLTGWVASEISYLIPGGSAKHTLDTRKGDCGAHSRLVTALCRAVGIPARLVSGCMYTPSYGGSFGQHCWNEIYTGKRAGWIAVDSTVGEVDYVDSGHIRLGEQTAFVPIEMQVVDYRAGVIAMGQEQSRLRTLARLPYEIGKSYTYAYRLNGSPLGKETFVVKGVRKDAGRTIFSCSSLTELTRILSATSEWQITGDGTPLLFTVEGKTKDKQYSSDCRFSENEVVQKIVHNGVTVAEETTELSGKICLASNNCVGLLACLAAVAPTEEGATRTFKFYHPATMRVYPAQLTVKGEETIDRAGGRIACRVIVVSLAGTEITMWVDLEGRLIRESESGGALQTELIAEDRAGSGETDE